MFIMLTTSSGYRELRASLRPLTESKLVLQINTCPPPRYTSPPDLKNRPVWLRPLFLPAFLLAPFNPTDTQSALLADAFSAALGSTWSLDKPGKQLIMELDRKTYAAWSVVWVPLDTKHSVKEWTTGNGVLTIWPTHLLRDLFPTSSTSIPVARPPSAILSSTTHTDFMTSALETYESMAIDRDAPVAPGIQTKPSETPVIVDSPESPMFGSDSGDKSDLDDLFSSHSAEGEDNEDLGYELLSDLPDDEPVPTPQERAVELDRDVVMESAHGQGSDNEDEAQEADVTQITEDDFAFFDSPASAADEMDAGEPVEVAAGEVEEPIEVVEPVEPEPVKTDAEEVKADPPTEEPDTVNAPPEPIPTDERSPQKPKPTKQVQFAPSPPSLVQTVTRFSDETDLIPTDFEALPLSGSLSASFPYSLPSPAATPEALRPDLLDRLSTQKEKKPHNYTSDWDVESEMSDVEEEDSPLGPLTPESMAEDDNEVGNDTLSTEADGSSDELRWRGKRCICTEWLSKPKSELQALALPWESGWAEPSTLLPSDLSEHANQSTLDPTLLAELDCTRLARHVIADRHLRAYILAHDSSRVNLAAEVDEDESLTWRKDGTSLYDLLQPSGESESVDIADGRLRHDRGVQQSKAAFTASHPRGLCWQRDAVECCGPALLASAWPSAPRRQEGHYAVDLI